MKKNIILLVLYRASSFILLGQGTQINDFNRNLSFVYPISTNTVDGYPYNVSLEYNANVPVISLYDYWFDDSTSDGEIADGWEIRNATRPYWIMGINGYAIQVFAYSPTPAIARKVWSYVKNGDTIIPEIKKDFIGIKNSYLNRDGLNNTDALSDYVWLIHGYDISNRLYLINEKGDQDIIKILKKPMALL